ncbi:MarR family winged helix-turn-helix transcriptional regulator [Rhodococcus koreensis]
MERSRGLPTDRPAVGQLLVRLLHEFRRELSEPMAERGYGDIRPPHLQIFGNIGDGRRLTEIAARAELSLSAASELINDLEELGYVERVPDTRDRRAKLVVPTTRGRQALQDAAIRVAEIERHWGGLVGRDRFDDACYLLSALLDELGSEDP